MKTIIIPAKEVLKRMYDYNSVLDIADVYSVSTGIVDSWLRYYGIPEIKKNHGIKYKKIKHKKMSRKRILEILMENKRIRDIESDKLELESDKLELESNKLELESKKLELESKKLELESKKLELEICDGSTCIIGSHVIYMSNFIKRNITMVGNYKNAIGRCCYIECNGEYSRISTHHIIPLSSGGTDTYDNYINVCDKCHGIAHRLYNNGDNLSSVYYSKVYAEQRILGFDSISLSNHEFGKRLKKFLRIRDLNVRTCDKNIR